VLRVARRARVEEKSLEVSRSVFRADRFTLWVQFADKR
jgi:GntR family transcriptional regulator